MVTLLLIDLRAEVDILDGNITYVKKNSDFGNITSINSSYSWGFKVAKTPHNTKIFGGLGLIGDTSNFPYQKVRCSILDNGIAIVGDGRLTITDTKDYYSAHVQDGIIDFYKDVSNDKVSDTVDLSEISHFNTVTNILNSFTSTTYRYVIANYNGQPLADLNNTTNLSPFALVPSISVKYLWDKIFEHYGWTYSGDVEEMNNLFMTYPNGVGYSEDGNTEVFNSDVEKRVSRYVNAGGEEYVRFSNITIDSQFIDPQTLSINPTNIIIFKETGNYKITFSIEGFLTWNFPPLDGRFEAQILVNGIPAGEIALSDETTSVSVEATMYRNSIVQIVMRNKTKRSAKFTTTGGVVKVETLGVQVIDFNEALIKYKVKDFFKEVLMRLGGLSTYADVTNKHIKLLSVETRINAPHLDWSDKYVERVSESYIYDNYARNNYFKHKYNSEGQDYKDGNLRVENENIPDEKTLFQSQTYAPEEELVEYNSQGFKYLVSNFKMFDVEVKQDPDTGDLLADYKALKDRFYIFSSELVDKDIYILNTPNTAPFPLASEEGNTYDDIVNEKFNKTYEILNDTRIHKIKLALSKWDVATLDLTKRYYFEQEKNYYILNSLTWKAGALSEGEFIRLKK